METPQASFHRWAELPEETLNPLLSRRLVTGERLMLAQVYLDKGCLVPKHSHENEQITYILEGSMRFWLGPDESQIVDLRAGDVLCIPPSMPHRAEALERTIDLDVFSPPRQDWLDGSDLYLRT